MSIHRTRRASFVAALGLAAVAAAPAHAAVLEVEPFNYPANLGQSLNGLSGGTGWGANAWQDTDTDVTLAATNASLAYPASVPLTPSGSRIELTAEDTAAAAIRGLGTTMNLATNGLEFYSSALFRRSAVTGESALVSFQDTSAALNVRWRYGIDATGAFFASVDPNNAAQRAVTTELAAADETYLLVSRIRTNTGASATDEVFLEVYGPGETVTAPATDLDWDIRVSGNSGVTLATARLDFVNAAGQTNQFDELRVGTAFEDVTGVVPEPATAGILAVAGVTALARRRRR